MDGDCASPIPPCLPGLACSLIAPGILGNVAPRSAHHHVGDLGQFRFGHHRLEAGFADPERGGYRTNEADEAALLVNNRAVQDNAQPSANAAVGMSN